MREINTHTLYINKSVLGQTLSEQNMTLEEWAELRGRTLSYQGDLVVFNDAMPDLDNYIGSLKTSLNGIGYVLGGKDFASVDSSHYWILDYGYKLEFEKVNPNFKVEILS